MAFNLKGLLQDEQFLIGAGLLAGGSKGQSFGEAAFPAILQTAQVKKAFTPTTQKTKQAFDNVLMKNVFVTDAEIAGMPNRFTPIDKSQKIEFDPDTNKFTVSSGSQKPDAITNKNLDKANKLKANYSILNELIPDLQSRISKSKTGFAGNVVSGFNIIGDQAKQFASIGVTDAYKKSAKKDVKDYLQSKGITKDAQNYAQVNSSVMNLSYVLASIAEPGNPKYSEGDIKRQLDRIGWGGSRDQIIAGLDQIRKDELRTAQAKFSVLAPNQEFGFSLDGLNSSNNQNQNTNNINNNQGIEEDILGYFK
jgi:hypothetical protein|tara:strand:- start:19 stop:942 length:924 start_codon:yes stop_codon:yes gene_type:complete